MFAITLDFDVPELRKEFGGSTMEAHDEITKELRELGFEWVREGSYINNSTENELVPVFEAIDLLSSIDWIKKTVYKVNVFRVEDLSDFTEIVKGE